MSNLGSGPVSGPFSVYHPQAATLRQVGNFAPQGNNLIDDQVLIPNQAEENFLLNKKAELLNSFKQQGTSQLKNNIMASDHHLYLGGRLNSKSPYADQGPSNFNHINGNSQGPNNVGSISNRYYSDGNQGLISNPSIGGASKKNIVNAYSGSLYSQLSVNPQNYRSNISPKGTTSVRQAGFHTNNVAGNIGLINNDDTSNNLAPEMISSSSPNHKKTKSLAEISKKLERMINLNHQMKDTAGLLVSQKGTPRKMNVSKQEMGNSLIAQLESFIPKSQSNPPGFANLIKEQFYHSARTNTNAKEDPVTDTRNYNSSDYAHERLKQEEFHNHLYAPFLDNQQKQSYHQRSNTHSDDRQIKSKDEGEYSVHQWENHVRAPNTNYEINVQGFSGKIPDLRIGLRQNDISSLHASRQEYEGGPMNRPEKINPFLINNESLVIESGKLAHTWNTNRPKGWIIDLEDYMVKEKGADKNMRLSDLNEKFNTIRNRLGIDLEALTDYLFSEAMKEETPLNKSEIFKTEISAEDVVSASNLEFLSDMIPLQENSEKPKSRSMYMPESKAKGSEPENSKKSEATVPRPSLQQPPRSVKITMDHIEKTPKQDKSPKFNNPTTVGFSTEKVESHHKQTSIIRVTSPDSKSIEIAYLDSKTITEDHPVSIEEYMRTEIKRGLSNIYNKAVFQSVNKLREKFGMEERRKTYLEEFIRTKEDDSEIKVMEKGRQKKLFTGDFYRNEVEILAQDMETKAPLRRVYEDFENSRPEMFITISSLNMLYENTLMMLITNKIDNRLLDEETEDMDDDLSLSANVQLSISNRSSFEDRPRLSLHTHRVSFMEEIIGSKLEIYIYIITIYCEEQ
jgi:hypothetical protein